MTNVSPTATDEEKALLAAWTRLNQTLQVLRPWPVRATHRVTASVADVLAAAGLVRELEERVLNDIGQPDFGPVSRATSAFLQANPRATFEEYIEAQNRIRAELAAEENEFMQAQLAEFVLVGDLQAYRARQYAAAVKAFYFFVRNLQDACFQILRLTYDPPQYGHSSIRKSLGKPEQDKELRKFLNAELPGYVDWFERFAHVRDNLKMGTDAFSGTQGPGPRMAYLHIHRVIENPPQSNIDCTVTWQDHAAALHHSTRFVDLAEKKFAARNALLE